MITPQKQLKNIPELIIASSTFQDGVISKYWSVEKEEGDDSQNYFFNCLKINPEKIVTIIVTGKNKLKVVNSYQKIIRDIDGIITNQKDIFFTILTADCIPLVIYDPTQKTFAFIHIGWHSVVSSLIRQAINLMQRHYRCQPNNLFAYLGPAIGKECYCQTGWRAFVKNFKFIFSGNSQFVSRKGRYFSFDIKGAAKQQLIKQSVLAEQIEVSPYCTFCNQKLFPSHFREGDSRQATILTVVGIKG